MRTSRPSHADRVLAAVERRPGPLEADDEITASWRRSVEAYGTDPEESASPKILTAGELKAYREPAETLVRDAKSDIDRLYSIVGQAGYCLLLSDRNGVCIDYRGSESEAGQFKRWGLYLGAVWSEEAEGTNGTGACLATQRPITVHRDQHFKTAYSGLSCSVAPIFGPTGDLVAALDVSSFDPVRSDRSHVMALAVTRYAARSIEEARFREHFRSATMLLVQPSGTSQLDRLALALDEDHRIVGADRNARVALALDDLRLRTGVCLWDVFLRDEAAGSIGRGQEWAGPLRNLVTDEVVTGFARPPLHRTATADGAWADLRAVRAEPAEPLRGTVHRGGLSPKALRRVTAYVEQHLAADIRLETLATQAGVSVFHLIRAFKESTGLTPHRYVLSRRVARAKQLLVTTDLPLLDIALQVGFSDHSHFSKHFQRATGMSPRTFRHANR